MPIGDMPAAIAADSPPEDPPGVRSRFHGLLVRPVTRLSVSLHAENSGRLVFARRMPPADNLLPPWVRTPAVSIESFTVTGTPCSGPSSTPLATAASAASALRR